MIKYPSGIDSSVELPTIIDGISPVTSAYLNNLRDALLSVETELGIKPSGTAGSVRARMDTFEALHGGGFIVAGDLSGTVTSQIVVGLRGNSIAAQTLSSSNDGYLLTWDNTDGYWYAATPPSGFTAGGDLTGTSTNQTVVSISGTSPIAIVPTILQWASTTVTPVLKQATIASGTGAVLTIQAQNTSSGTGGALNLTSGTGTTAAGSTVLQTGGTTRLTVNATGVITIANLGTGVVHADSSGNLTSSTIVNADVSASAAIAGSKLANATTGATGVIQLTGDLGGTGASPTVLSLTGASGSVSISSAGNILTWVTATTAPGLAQADKTTNAGTGATLKIQAQNETGTTSTGGGLTLTSGTGTTAAGAVIVQTGGTTRLTANATGVITVANLSTGVVHADSSGNLTSSTIVNADVSGSAAIAYSKLNLSTSIVNADIATGAAIAYSKLNLTTSIVNGDIATAAAIAVSKLASGTSAQVLLNNSTPTPTWTSITGDITLSNAGVVAVTSIQSNTVTSGALTKGQFFVASSTSNWAATTLSGDITESATTAGQLTVVSINSATVPAAGSLTTGNGLYVTGASALSYSALNLAGGANYVTGTLPVGNLPSLAGDVTGTITANTVISLTGGSGVVNIAATGNIITWATATTAPGIAQTDKTTNGGTGAALTIQAQNETGTTSTGGALNLTSGTGTTAAGNVVIKTGGTARLTIAPASAAFADSATALTITPVSSGTTTVTAAATVTAFTINQSDLTTNSGTGAALTVQAQNETGTTSTGGTLSLTSGTGTTAAGPVLIKTGGTTRLTANATGVITVANLSTGVVHADSSGNLTSSTIVNADVSATAAIAVSKLAAGTSAQVLINNATPTPTWTTFSGDVSVSATGVTTVVSISGGQRVAVRETAISSTLTTADYLVVVTAGGTTQTLPASPTGGDTYEISLTYTGADLSTTTIAGNGHNIAGQANLVVTEDYGSRTLTYATTSAVWILT